MNDQATSLALFCKVVDNYGDIGICWRLARQLEQEHGIAVTLWVDDLISFKRICPEVVIDCDVQQIGTVIVRHWRDQDGVFTVNDIADIVIEFFGCNIPPAYIATMALCTPQPAWINLEGLSAEEWVEGCHTLPSPHPTLSLTKYFFYPGFTARTGGLLVEANLAQQRQEFQQDPVAMAAFLTNLGVTQTEIASLKISLFCYPFAPVSELFDTWQSGDTAITCLVPEGVAIDAMQVFFGGPVVAGSVATKGALTVRILPFITQQDYDKLLWACDLNFVRGEDSFVRAQWAEKPFVWHIYPQDKNLHHVKLQAFLRRYLENTNSEGLAAMWRSWNHMGNPPEEIASAWPLFHAEMPKITEMTIIWRQHMLENGDFTSNLLRFVETIK
ncbi:elongation factor P maturation arginine rhamnosyltransferase EarP [Glaciimonas sp. GS1]|uniref:Protein-arginine rhamnosyltransferase n=1 Tax=Glaciimonas soli TaxID=2590999 RepID=A0A843YHD5_9BURK|nr:elongation factor P maturation arginine rhamnosyltransferase EarP [Glaciimonas soli]